MRKQPQVQIRGDLDHFADLRIGGIRVWDSRPLSRANRMYADMVALMQPGTTVDVFEGQVYVNGVL